MSLHFPLDGGIIITETAAAEIARSLARGRRSESHKSNLVEAHPE